MGLDCSLSYNIMLWPAAAQGKRARGRTCQVKLPLQCAVSVSCSEYVYVGHTGAWGAYPKLATLGGWELHIRVRSHPVVLVPFPLSSGHGFPASRTPSGQFEAFSGFPSQTATPAPRQLAAAESNQGSSCSRQNWVEECLRSINTCHHSVSTTAVNAPKKWEQPELRLPVMWNLCCLPQRFLGWCFWIYALHGYHAVTEWLGFLTSALMTVLCSSVFALLFSLIGSTSGVTKYFTPARVPPLTMIHGNATNIDRGCEDLWVPGGCPVTVEHPSPEVPEALMSHAEHARGSLAALP